MSGSLNSPFGRAFVTGATGFLGRRVSRALVARGVEVHASHHRSAPPPHSSIHWHDLDLADQTGVGRLMNTLKPQALLHLAWDVGQDYQVSEENDKWLAWSLVLAHEFASAGGRHLLVAGSCAEYAWSTPVLREDSPCAPTTPYGLAKVSLHREVSNYSDQGVTVLWPRLFFLFGEGERFDRVVPRIIRDVATGKPIDWIAPALRRDYLDVNEAADAIVYLICGGFGGVVNVASGRAPTVQELVSTVAAALAADLAPMAATLTPPAAPAEIRADVSRLHQLGWRPSRTVDEGLTILAHAYREASSSTFSKEPSLDPKGL